VVSFPLHELEKRRELSRSCSPVICSKQH